MVTGQNRTFLFLQGPHGPFFARLARMLNAAGAKTWRVGFNAGDAAFWKDKDTYMPPIPSQRFLIKAYQKEKKQMSFPQRDKYLQQKLFIDVNDPRHDYLLMDMKEKNQHLRALLEADVKNPLHDVQPFRHQLMHQKAINAKMRDAVIPLLEKDIVEDKALIGFLEKFCKEDAKRELDHGIS